MSTNALVRAAWATYVWAQINNGRNAFDYDVWPESRRKHAQAGLFDGEVDFWIYSIRHRNEYLLGQSEVKHFEVEVVRTLQNDPEGEAYSTVIDDFNSTLYNLVKSSLGDTWGGTVSLWRPPAEAPAPIRTTFNQVDVFEARVLYTAEAIVSF